MCDISYSSILTHLMDREFSSGYPSANCATHMAWRFITGRTDFGVFPPDEVEPIIADALRAHHIWVPRDGRISHPTHWTDARGASWQHYCFS